MKISWKKVDKNDQILIESWMSNIDRHNLCMEQQDWATTARGINECLKDMKNGEFFELLGFVGSKPAVAMMLGIEESGNALNLYNIILNPLFRGHGIGSQAIAEVFGNENAMFLKKAYSQIKVYTLPENQAMKKILLSQGFSAPTQDGDFLFYKKDLTKNNISEQGK